MPFLLVCFTYETPLLAVSDSGNNACELRSYVCKPKQLAYMCELRRLVCGSKIVTCNRGFYLNAPFCKCIPRAANTTSLRQVWPAYGVCATQEANTTHLRFCTSGVFVKCFWQKRCTCGDCFHKRHLWGLRQLPRTCLQFCRNHRICDALHPNSTFLFSC